MTRIVTSPRTPAPAGDPDPFRLGWRWIRHKQPDGTETIEEVPLTLEDLLHPQWGDFIVQGTAHDDDCAYLRAVLKARFRGVPGALVLHDCRVEWDDPELKWHS